MTISTGITNGTTSVVLPTHDLDDNEKGGDDDSVDNVVALTVNDKTKSLSSSSTILSMSEWFQHHASPEEADAMSALQLDYRFQGDNFGSRWWIHLQRLGFQHFERKYQLPKSMLVQGTTATAGGRFDATGIYQQLDALAVPQVTSAFDVLPSAAFAVRELSTTTSADVVHTNPTTTAETFSLVEFWRNVRDELIFHEFHKDIEKECRIRTRACQESSLHSNSQRKRKNNIELSLSSFRPHQRQSQQGNLTSISSLSSRPGAAQDAELFMVRNNKKRRKRQRQFHQKDDINTISTSSAKRSKGKHLLIKEKDDVEFLSFTDYATAARQQQKQKEEYLLDIEHDYICHFEEWRFLLSTNHSLLLYGVGSKRKLLGRFVHDGLDTDGDVIELNGFDKSITLGAILELLVDHWLHGKTPSIDLYNVHWNRHNGGVQNLPSSPTLPFYPMRGDTHLVQQAAAIANRIATIVEMTLRPVYLVVHNIDGPALRNMAAQEGLSVLVSQSTTQCGWNAIRLVASIDHVNAPTLLWDPSTNHRFQWIWKEANTQQPYIEEVLESVMAIEQSGRMQKRSVNNKQNEDTEIQRESIFSVLKSLASRHTQSLQQLAWLQLESKKTKNDWIAYVDLLNQCRLKCVVTHDAQLRSYLGELMDHHIVTRNSSEIASATSYRIPYPDDILDLILDYQLSA
jgi:hypothetical protein